MNPDTLSISIVLDPSYRLSLLRVLADAGPVWIVDTPINRLAAEQLWKESPTQNDSNGITTFQAYENRFPEQLLMGWMDTIDLHHGVYSADPPYTVIRVIGSTLTLKGRQFLETFGFDSFVLTDEGVEAVRRLPDPAGAAPKR